MTNRKLLKQLKIVITLTLIVGCISNNSRKNYQSFKLVLDHPYFQEMYYVRNGIEIDTLLFLRYSIDDSIRRVEFKNEIGIGFEFNRQNMGAGPVFNVTYISLLESQLRSQFLIDSSKLTFHVRNFDQFTAGTATVGSDMQVVRDRDSYLVVHNGMTDDNRLSTILVYFRKNFRKKVDVNARIYYRSVITTLKKTEIVEFDKNL